MRRILFVLMMAATMLVANAESGEWAVGGQVVYGSKAETAGLGPHVKYCLTDAFRASLSGNYYFKHSGVSAFDVNLEANYLFNVGGGFEYLVSDHFGLNAEVKYQIISHASQVVFGIGASYRF